MPRSVRLPEITTPAVPLDADMRMTLRAALGLDCRKVAYKNRIAFNVGREGIASAAHCEGYGLLVQDPAEHYGKMRVFRVTRTGLQALGLTRLAPELLALAERAAQALLARDQGALPLTGEAA